MKYKYWIFYVGLAGPSENIGEIYLTVEDADMLNKAYSDVKMDYRVVRA